jgi:hypothetical protein
MAYCVRARLLRRQAAKRLPVRAPRNIIAAKRKGFALRQYSGSQTQFHCVKEYPMAIPKKNFERKNSGPQFFRATHRQHFANLTTPKRKIHRVLERIIFAVDLNAHGFRPGKQIMQVVQQPQAFGVVWVLCVDVVVHLTDLMH